HPVEVVVREVHPDLEPRGHDERGAEPPPDDVSSGSGPDDHGNEPDAERPRARAEPPHAPAAGHDAAAIGPLDDAALAHGRFGKREKSGSRLPVNASRPSCASSPM